MAQYDFLANLNGAYAAAKAAPAAGQLPPGRYHAILDRAAILPPTDTKPGRFSCSFIVTEGEYAGRHLFMDWRLTETGLPFLKQFIQRIGIGLQTLGQLPDFLDDFPGKICQLSVVENKKNPQYLNTYCDRLLGTGRVEDYRAPAPAAAGAAPEADYVPVGDEEDLPF